MQTIPSTHTHDLMAAWLATGGAVDAPAPAETAGDDGLSTAPHTFIVYCVGDDGLSSAPHTFIVYCVEDDGLAAVLPSIQIACRADDGLDAISVTRASCVEADGLKAGHFTGPWACR